MALLGVVLGTLVNAVLLAWTARRLLGVPVGWPRTLLLSLVASGLATPVLTWVLAHLELAPATAGAHPGAVAAVSVLFLAWLVAAQVAVLAIGEALVPTGSLPGPLELVRSAPSRWRRLRRSEQIVRIATRHGLGPYLTRRSEVDDDQPASVTARALREALAAGGVTFVKLGQVLSTRPDVLPPEYIQELSRLHSHVPPQPWAIVRGTLVRELGRAPEEAFAEVDPEPMAAASVGQVHRARLRDGTPVVIKVQRAGARAQVAADLALIRRLTVSLEHRASWARGMRVRSLVEGFARSLDDELDYRIEAANVAAVRAGQPAGSPIDIPRVYPELSTSRVLVMEALPGQPLSSSADALAAIDEADRSRMAQDLLGLVLHQLLVTGVFHADLHAGNVLLALPGPDGAARLGLLDFGSVGRLDRGARTSLALLLTAVDRQDAAAATQAMTDLLQPPAGLDDRAVERDLSELLMRYTSGPVTGSSGAMFVDLLHLANRHRLSVPPQIAAALRALGALEGTLTLLSPDIDLIGEARTAGGALVAAQLTGQGVRDEVTGQLASLLPILQRLPRRLSSIVEDAAAGEFTITVHALQDPRERQFVRGLVQQVVVAILAATAALCGVALTLAEHGPLIAGGLHLSTYMGLVLMLIALVLGSRAVVRAFRRDRDDLDLL